MQMKKFLTMALMAAFATTTFAQEATVKEAKKLFGKGDFDAAAPAQIVVLIPDVDPAAEVVVHHDVLAVMPLTSRSVPG